MTENQGMGNQGRAEPHSAGGPQIAGGPKSGGDNFGGEHLRQIVARIERLEEEKQALAEDIKQVYAEAKAHGFDAKILRQVIRIRKMDTNDRMEQETLIDLYLDALGMRPAAE